MCRKVQAQILERFFSLLWSAWWSNSLIKRSCFGKTIKFFFFQNSSLNMATICRGILYTKYIWSYHQDNTMFRNEKRSSLVSSTEDGGTFPGMFYYPRCMRRLECCGVCTVYDNHKQMAVNSLVATNF